MTTEQIKAAIAQAAKAWIEKDAEGFASLFLPDGEFIVPGDRWTGREQIHRAVLDYASAYSEVKIDKSSRTNYFCTGLWMESRRITLSVSSYQYE